MSAPSIPVTVVVAFHSRRGVSETCALTAAVGSVNARALIRMRRMNDVATDTHDGGAELARMQKEYIPPGEADIAGTDALIVVAPPSQAWTSPEWAPLAAMLASLGAKGALRGKVAGVLAGGDAASEAAFSSFLLDQGFVVVPATAVRAQTAANDAASHQAYGRLVAEVSRTVKSLSR